MNVRTYAWGEVDDSGESPEREQIKIVPSRGAACHWPDCLHEIAGRGGHPAMPDDAVVLGWISSAQGSVWGAVAQTHQVLDRYREWLAEQSRDSVHLTSTPRGLIAAAPDLLEALRDMLAGWIYIRGFHGDLYGVGWDRAQGKAEAAMRKAEGRFVPTDEPASQMKKEST